MPGLAERIAAAAGVQSAEVRPRGGQHGYAHVTGTLSDGRAFFAKSAPGPGGPAEALAPEALAAEANGLRWLAAPGGGPPVPAVLGQSDGLLVIELVAPPGQPSPEAARRFGAELARLHAAAPESFGAPWPGYIASLPLDNTAGPDWPSWYAERRLLPYLRRARDAGALTRAAAAPLEVVISRIGQLAGPAEPPARIHGDLWSGNLLWHGGRGWLIDPAAHGGHRETDLAMLALFGAPHLAAVIEGYTETAPLADGWRSRVPLHQLHPLLVHVCLFGGGYAAQLDQAARAALAALPRRPSPGGWGNGPAMTGSLPQPRAEPDPAEA